MSVKAQDLILDAFVMIGVYSPVQTMTSTDANFGLNQLNEIIDQWQEENLFCQQLIARTLTISSGKASYTIGPNGSPSLIAPRPTAIEVGPSMASCTISAVTSPVNVVSAIEWSMIESINSGTGTPDTLFYDPQYPMGVMNVAPTPIAGGTITFNAMQILSSFADLASTSYVLAQGVQKALEANLALSLMPSYTGTKQPNPRLMADGAEGKDFLRWGNIVSRAMLNRRMITTGRQPPPPAKGE